jgi:hypothetical protein
MFSQLTDQPMTTAMSGYDSEPCPSGGSHKVALQGRLRDGKSIRELICISCKHVWPAPPSLHVPIRP